MTAKWYVIGLKATFLAVTKSALYGVFLLVRLSLSSAMARSLAFSQKLRRLEVSLAHLQVGRMLGNAITHLGRSG